MDKKHNSIFFLVLHCLRRPRGRGRPWRGRLRRSPPGCLGRAQDIRRASARVVFEVAKKNLQKKKGKRKQCHQKIMIKDDQQGKKIRADAEPGSNSGLGPSRFPTAPSHKERGRDWDAWGKQKTTSQIMRENAGESAQCVSVGLDGSWNSVN